MRCALVIVARYPAIGQVKTRLARRIGASGACALYRAFLCDLDARFGGGAATLVWAFDPPESDFRSVVSGGRCLPQEGVDLGARMHNCFRRLLGEGFERVIMIGADCPHVRSDWLLAAETQLTSEDDVVLGPSLDGGYYLLGMRAPHDLFSGIPMSTPHVRSQTVERAAALGLRVHLLPETFDIDEATDLVRLRAEFADPKLAQLLPHTRAALLRLPEARVDS